MCHLPSQHLNSPFSFVTYTSILIQIRLQSFLQAIFFLRNIFHQNSYKTHAMQRHKKVESAKLQEASPILWGRGAAPTTQPRGREGATSTLQFKERSDCLHNTFQRLGACLNHTAREEGGTAFTIVLVGKASCLPHTIIGSETPMP